MLLSLLLRGISADAPIIFDNGVPVPLDARVKRLVDGISPPFLRHIMSGWKMREMQQKEHYFLMIIEI